MRHQQWDKVLDYLHQVQEHLGVTIHDTRCGRSWDVGQAVCAEAYGPDWMNHPVFVEWNAKDDSEPPEPHYLECARRMAEGYKPEWAA